MGSKQTDRQIETDRDSRETSRQREMGKDSKAKGGSSGGSSSSKGKKAAGDADTGKGKGSKGSSSSAEELRTCTYVKGTLFQPLPFHAYCSAIAISSLIKEKRAGFFVVF